MMGGSMELSSLQALLFGAVIFASASGLTYGVYLALRKRDFQQRVDAVVLGHEPGAGNGGPPRWVETVVKLSKPIARLSIPREGWEKSELARQFMHAGLRDPNAPTLFFGMKAALAIALSLLVWIQQRWAAAPAESGQILFVMAVVAAIGYILPNVLLTQRIKDRQRELFEGFPDALDLLTVCVEAGLSLEAAIGRVAREIRLRSPVLADELELVSLEWRAGIGKERALRNLALRTGVEDVETLVATLVQSEKYGTSIGDALRTHSRTLRTKRQQRAEETAAKIAVKLSFPLIVFIFPSILIVVAGPAMIQIGKTLSQM
jgi:tight adherence protein C